MGGREPDGGGPALPTLSLPPFHAGLSSLSRPKIAAQPFPWSHLVGVVRNAQTVGSGEHLPGPQKPGWSGREQGGVPTRFCTCGEKEAPAWPAVTIPHPPLPDPHGCPSSCHKSSLASESLGPDAVPWWEPGVPESGPEKGWEPAFPEQLCVRQSVYTCVLSHPPQ